jgi:iron complex outermembrane receptor protein
MEQGLGRFSLYCRYRFFGALCGSAVLLISAPMPIRGAVHDSTAAATLHRQDTTVQRATPTAYPAPRTADSDSTVGNLDTLNVTALRTLRTASAVTTICSESFLGRFTDLPAVLEQISGVSVRRTGGFGEYADAAIRGNSPKQVQVFLDGIPLNSAAGGAVDLSKIPLSSLRDVTVYKGTAPLELLGNTAGAVISLRSGRAIAMTTGILETGSFGYRKAGTFIRKKIGATTHQFSVDYSGARNDYPFEDDNGTRYNPDDDAMKKKNHNAFSLIGVNYANNRQINPANRIAAAVALTDEHQELFHQQFVDTLQLANRSSSSVQGQVHWEYEPSESGRLGVRFEGRYRRGIMHDPLGQLYIGGERKDQESFPYTALRFDGTKVFNRHLSVRVLAVGGYEGYASVNLLAPPAKVQPSAVRINASAAGELSLQVNTLHLVTRYHHLYVRDSANFTPNHGSGKPLPQTWKNHFPNGTIDAIYALSKWCSLDAAFRYEHLPVSLSDRYGWGNNYLGNPRLLPERRLEGSIGLIVRNRRFESSLSGFSGATFDMIELQPQSQRVLMAINTGNVRQSGVEWDIHCNPLPPVSIDNHFTVISKIRTRNDNSNEVKLLFFSPVENDLRISFTRRWFIIGHSLHYRSPFLKGYTVQNDRVAPAPALNLYCSWMPAKPITLTYRLENYLDVSYAPVAYYTPLPGRMHFFIGKIQW